MPQLLRRSLLAAFVPLLLVSARAFAEVQTVPVTRITGEIDIAAPPAAVWGSITTGASFVSWCPYWEGEGNAKKTLSKVGDVLDFTDDWGNGGKSIVTYIDPDKEIRISHEPSNGSYMCQSKLMLTKTDKGTHVAYVEQYTDESEPKDAEATAVTMQESVDGALKALKDSVEGAGK